MPRLESALADEVDTLLAALTVTADAVRAITWFTNMLHGDLLISTADRDALTDGAYEWAAEAQDNVLFD
jgi:hypothetical protein